MITKILSYKCRIYPNKTQIQKFEKDLKACRIVYNKCKEKYEQDLKKQEYTKDEPQGKKYFYNLLQQLIKQYPCLQETDQRILIDAYHNLIRAITLYKKGISNHPKKSNTKTLNSFKIRPNPNIYIENQKIHLDKYGTIKIHDKRKITGKILNYIIKKHYDEWYIIVTTRQQTQKYPKTGKAVGIDLGIKELAILSNGEKIHNINLEKEDEKLNKLYKQLNRKDKNSKNYEKILKKVHKANDKRTNKINDYLNKLSARLVKEYDFIAMETLHILDMLNKSNNDKIRDASWRKLIEMTKYKSQAHGKTFIQVSSNYPSTKLCHNCGYKNNKLTLKDREWTCPECKTFHDRDVNAAINILIKAQEIDRQNKIKNI